MIRRLILALALCAASFGALAQSLTPAQVATLRTLVLAEPTLASARQSGDDTAIAAWLNAPSSPSYIVWRTSVTKEQIQASASFDWTRVDNLSVGKARIWDQMFYGGSINPSQANYRAGIDATWVGTQADLNVRSAVYAVCKRTATRAEKALATGTGSDASPATMGFEGMISAADVAAARNS